MFRNLEGHAIVVLNGVYRECNLFAYSDMLFAKLGVGYIRLNTNGSTSYHNAKMDKVKYNGDLFANQYGQIVLTEDKGYKKIPDTAKWRV